MAKSLISDRIIFKNKDGQQVFISKVKDSLGLNYAQLAKVVEVSNRTFKDWSTGKFRMSYLSAKTLSSKSCISIPRGTKIINWKKHLANISTKGGIANYEKNKIIGGGEIKRKIAWAKWWNNKGKFKEQIILTKKNINKPPKSVKLAEFVGIMMGDGGISEYHTTVTLHSKDDLEYSIFVCKLIEELFNISPKIYKKKSSLAIDIVVHRKNLVEFCHSIGLIIGNKLKQGLDIPQWIKDNNEYSIACVRGLVDTDGSVFMHKYKVNGKEYSYKKLSFTSMSMPLLHSVSSILKGVYIQSRIHRNKDMRIESVEDVKKYFCIFSTSNPKHLKRYTN